LIDLVSFDPASLNLNRFTVPKVHVGGREDHEGQTTMKKFLAGDVD